MLKLRKDTSGVELNAAAQIKFLSYLAQALANGFAINQGLALLPAIWPQKKDLLAAMSRKLAGGASLGAVLQEAGFSATIAAQINLAFEEGRLERCLDQLVLLLKLKDKQLRKIRGELAYPAVLAAMMLFLLVFMQTILQKEFTQDSLPGTIVVAGVVGLVALFVLAVLRLSQLFKRQNYAALKKLAAYPFVGPAVKVYVQYLLTFDLALLLGNGFSMQQICQLACQQPADSLQNYLGAKIGGQMEAGATMQEMVAGEKLLPDRLQLLLAAGSDRGELAKRCQLLSQSLFSELILKINSLIVSIQPVCFIAIGIAIIGMYLKLLMPMYAMMQTF